MGVRGPKPSARKIKRAKRVWRAWLLKKVLNYDPFTRGQMAKQLRLKLHAVVEILNRPPPEGLYR